jgi:hydrogenase maturation protease
MNAVAVLGIGNTLRGDDGIGVHAVRQLIAAGGLPDADLYAGDPVPFDMLGILLDHDLVIVLQAAGGGLRSGTVYRTSPDDLEPSGHDLGLPEAIRCARELGASTEVVVLAVQPQHIGWSAHLSETGTEALPHLIDALLAEIGPPFARAEAAAAAAPEAGAAGARISPPPHPFRDADLAARAHEAARAEPVGAHRLVQGRGA